jgi:hypothetical protein
MIRSIVGSSGSSWIAACIVIRLKFSTVPRNTKPEVGAIPRILGPTDVDQR